jgi:hypothetical protein
MPTSVGRKRKRAGRYARIVSFELIPGRDDARIAERDRLKQSGKWPEFVRRALDWSASGDLWREPPTDHPPAPTVSYEALVQALTQVLGHIPAFPQSLASGASPHHDTPGTYSAIVGDLEFGG